VDVLIGDSSKAKKELGWKPSYSFGDIVEEMVEYDLNGGNEHGSFTSRDS
jgi:GDPmannose 4,6-dehydratase